jgi:hypothetical protein
MWRWIGIVLLVAGCTSSSQPSVSPIDVGSESPTPATISSSPSIQVSGAASLPASPGAGVAVGCVDNVTAAHQAPELEATLPAELGGRPMARWSLQGRTVFACLSDASPEELDEFFAGLETPDDPAKIDLDHIRYAVAGRSDVQEDPPFFIFALDRPIDDDEIYLALLTMFSGANYFEPDPAVAADLDRYDALTLGGKSAFMGSVDMLQQDEHQRGRPVLYQTDDHMYLVITDDFDWADEALSKLP